MATGKPGNDVSFEFNVAGTLIALRFVVRALVLTHPDKAAMLATLRDLVKHPDSGADTLAAPIQVWVDRILAEQMEDID